MYDIAFATNLMVFLDKAMISLVFLAVIFIFSFRDIFQKTGATYFGIGVSLLYLHPQILYCRKIQKNKRL